MSLQTLAYFIPACFALNMAFGPNNLLSVMIGAQYGVGPAIMCATGRLIAFTGLLIVIAAGLGALLFASDMVFTIIKFAGAAYLAWLGLRLLRAPVPEGVVETARRPAGLMRTLFVREFVIALGNPKAILIFTAFFPQFVLRDAYWSSFATLGAIFLVLEVGAIALYALLGASLRRFADTPRAFLWINRVSGAVMIAFGALLAFTPSP